VKAKSETRFAFVVGITDITTPVLTGITTIPVFTDITIIGITDVTTMSGLPDITMSVVTGIITIPVVTGSSPCRDCRTSPSPQDPPAIRVVAAAERVIGDGGTFTRRSAQTHQRRPLLFAM
jgi:hypothetical protein